MVTDTFIIIGKIDIEVNKQYIFVISSMTQIPILYLECNTKMISKYECGDQSYFEEFLRFQMKLTF